MRVLHDDGIPIELWEEFVRVNVHATPFQTPAFYRFLKTLKSVSARGVAVSEKGVLKALAVVTIQKENGPAGFFSKRGIIYGGPLATEDSPQALGVLLKTISQIAGRGVIYIETRNLSDFTLYRDIFISNGFRYVPYLNFRVDTSDGELMKQRISNSRVRQIKKSIRRDVTCKMAETPDAVQAFYEMLTKLYKEKLFKPLPDKEFFMNFFEAKLGVFLLVWFEQKVIGGIMCPILEGRALYEFYVCGLDEDYKELYPSVMATWFAMEYAGKHGIPLFDFMGAGMPGEQYGVRDFKARFGGELVEYGRFRKIRKPLLYRVGEAGLNLRKSLGL
jgi:hypothetical protein